MEKLIKNITRLIARHNCVILPGFGAFLAHKVPARYNAEERVFMPPHRTLGFNPQVTVDDALLLSEYTDCGMLSYEEATTLLTRDIANLRDRLSQKGTLCFGELGTFSMDINNRITFIPNENGIDDPYNFGFEPIAMPLLSDYKKKEIVIKRRDLSRYIAGVAAILIAFFLVAPFGEKRYEPAIQASVTSLVPTLPSNAATVQATTVTDDICEIAPVPETVTENINIEEVSIPAPEAFNNVQPAENEKQFYIIVASSPNAENAQLAIKEMSAKLSSDYIIVEGSGRHRIAYGCYSSNDDAIQVLSQVKGTFPDAWILTR